MSWVLLALLALAVAREHCKRCYKNTPRARLGRDLAWLIALLAFSQHVNSAEAFSFAAVKENTYVQLGVFRAHASQSQHKFAQALPNSDQSLIFDRYDVKRTGYRAALHYDFSAHSALSFGYLNLGDVKVNLRADIDDSGAFARAFANNYPITGSGYTLSYWYKNNLSENLDLRGEIGLFFMDGNIDYHVQEISANYPGGTYPLVSTQMLYSFNPHFSVGASASLLSMEGQRVYIGGLVFEWRLGEI